MNDWTPDPTVLRVEDLIEQMLHDKGYVNAEKLVDQMEALGLLRPDPRVWRSGDAEPGEDVRAVLDACGDVWQRHVDGWNSRFSAEMIHPWSEAVDYGPLVEVTLPQVVTS